MVHPIWIGICSCGEPTGLVVLAEDPPKPGQPRAGHERHTVRVKRLDSPNGDELTAEQHGLLRRALST